MLVKQRIPGFKAVTWPHSHWVQEQCVAGILKVLHTQKLNLDDWVDYTSASAVLSALDASAGHVWKRGRSRKLNKRLLRAYVGTGCSRETHLDQLGGRLRADQAAGNQRRKTNSEEL